MYCILKKIEEADNAKDHFPHRTLINYEVKIPDLHILKTVITDYLFQRTVYSPRAFHAYSITVIHACFTNHSRG